MKNVRNVLWGAILILVGVLLGTNALGVTNIDIFFDGWWTLFIIVPSFIDLFKEHDKTGNIIGLVIGTFLLLACQNIVSFDIIWELFIPIVLIIIGFSMLFKNTISNKVSKEIKKLNKTSKQNREYYATFSGQKLNFSDEEFTGASLSAIFGGIDCDLTKAVIKDDVVINASSIFGGIDIRVPEGVNIKINSTSIFGGVTNKKKENKKDNKTIYINATCLFGGVEIK